MIDVIGDALVHETDAFIIWEKMTDALTGGIPPTYFIHEVTDYVLTGTLDVNGYPYVQVKRFQPVALPSFLEGPVRQTKISNKNDI